MSTTNQESSPAKVLVAEDDPTTLKVWSIWLEMAGYDVQRAADGAEAWRKIGTDCPDIVVTDWNMPHMSGLELCRAIRKQHSRHQVYLLVATARDGQDDLKQAMDAGADDFLTKPVEQNELQARIRQAECAVSRLRNQAKLAETDPLTSLMNRRTFSDHCEREIASCNETIAPLSCIILDVDFFKQLNDTHGHAAGDEALRAIAAALRSVLRPTDHICRLGGDEFCALLPNTCEHEAAQLAERTRAAIAKQHIANSARISATFGVAEWKCDISTPTDLIELADQTLLAAKRIGRGCVVRYGELDNALCESAVQEYRSMLTGVLAGQVMTGPVVSLRDEQPLRDAAELFLGMRVNAAPVVNDDMKLVGIVSESHLLNAVVSHRQWSMPIAEVMTSTVVCFQEDTPVVEIWDFLRRVTLRHTVIVNDGSPVGVLSRSTLLRWLSNSNRNEAVASVRQRESASTMHTRLQLVANAVVAAVGNMEAEIFNQGAAPIPSILNAVTNIQESAQQMLLLCQTEDRFEPVG